MSEKTRSAVNERIFAVNFNSFSLDSLTETDKRLSSFRSYCCENGFDYEKQTKWKLECDIDPATQLPQMKDSSGSIDEFHFIHHDSEKRKIEWVFRIFPDRVVFNFLKNQLKDPGSFNEAKDIFSPLWEEFKKDFDFKEESQVEVSYVLHLDKYSLSDQSLYGPDWLEVKDISVLFGCIGELPYSNCRYIPPFRSIQNWDAEHPDFQKVQLRCLTQSLQQPEPKLPNISTLSIEFQLCVYTRLDSDAFIGKASVLFEILTELYDKILTEKAKNAIEGDWR